MPVLCQVVVYLPLDCSCNFGHFVDADGRGNADKGYIESVHDFMTP